MAGDMEALLTRGYSKFDPDSGYRPNTFLFWMYILMIAQVPAYIFLVFLIGLVRTTHLSLLSMIVAGIATHYILFGFVVVLIYLDLRSMANPNFVIWLMICILFPFVGPLVYLVARRSIYNSMRK